MGHALTHEGNRGVLVTCDESNTARKCHLDGGSGSWSSMITNSVKLCYQFMAR